MKKKVLLTGSVRIGREGISSHTGHASEKYGDPDKAVHHYAFDHYEIWRRELPGRPLLEHPGAFSENFSTLGVTEHTLCIGDVLRVGSARLQVSHGREACDTMNQRFRHPQMSEMMHAAHRNGWFYRVLDEGEARVGEFFILEERLHPEWTIARVQQFYFSQDTDEKILGALSVLEGLAQCWKESFMQRLDLATAADSRY